MATNELDRALATEFPPEPVVLADPLFPDEYELTGSFLAPGLVRIHRQQRNPLSPPVRKPEMLGDFLGL